MEYLTTHEAKHPRAGIRPLGGALFRGVIPHEAGHVGVNLPSLHDDFPNDLIERFCLSHASDIARGESVGPYNKVAKHD